MWPPLRPHNFKNQPSFPIDQPNFQCNPSSIKTNQLSINQPSPCSSINHQCTPCTATGDTRRTSRRHQCTSSGLSRQPRSSVATGPLRASAGLAAAVDSSTLGRPVLTASKRTCGTSSSSCGRLHHCCCRPVSNRKRRRVPAGLATLRTLAAAATDPSHSTRRGTSAWGVRTGAMAARQRTLLSRDFSPALALQSQHLPATASR
jgi:hypothetical protein